MFVWLLACQQSVFQRYHSEKHLSFFPTRWRRKPTGTEITPLSPYVCNSQGSVHLSHRSTAAPATDGFANCCWVPCGAGRRSIDICGRRAAGAGAQQQMRVALSREPTKEASRLNTDCSPKLLFIYLFYRTRHYCWLRPIARGVAWSARLWYGCCSQSDRDADARDQLSTINAPCNRVDLLQVISV